MRLSDVKMVVWLAATVPATVMASGYSVPDQDGSKPDFGRVSAYMKNGGEQVVLSAPVIDKVIDHGIRLPEDMVAPVREEQTRVNEKGLQPVPGR